ncbi:MAG: hypothetical protein K8S00_14515, partial [Bacteroidales bacterium]|nr:hypothetical protein [Bacteroidales bacterium]
IWTGFVVSSHVVCVWAHSVIYAKQFVSHPELHKLMDNILPEFLYNRSSEKILFDEEEIQVRFLSKLEEWIQSFTFLSYEELNVISLEFSISVKALMRFLYHYLFMLKEISQKKIFDYLVEYSHLISKSEINAILDYFNSLNGKEQKDIKPCWRFH